jgi:hypothetical protein
LHGFSQSRDARARDSIKISSGTALFQLAHFGDTQEFVIGVQPREVITLGAIKKTALVKVNV